MACSLVPKVGGAAAPFAPPVPTPMRSTVVRVTSHFDGKTQSLTPVYPKPLDFFEPKFAQMITSGISYDVQNLAKIRSRGAFRRIREI